MDLKDAKHALDIVINKARVHLYKPIQIAEILYRDRVKGDIDLVKLETYRTQSRAWRKKICLMFIGRDSTSSARYQDDLFNDNATPPPVLAKLGEVNRASGGIVESYIYKHLQKKHLQMRLGLSYCLAASPSDFEFIEFIESFRSDPGLRRSIDKIYEIVVYALFSALVKELDLMVTVTLDENKLDLLEDFSDFARKVICISPGRHQFSSPAKLYRVGVTNAADRGLDMWANFGPAIQVKHLSLDEDRARDIVGSITADRIVIVCKTSEKKTILSLLNQIGWKSRIQSIITENDLNVWYEKALRGKFKEKLGEGLLTALREEIAKEFPDSVGDLFTDFFSGRGYDQIADDVFWSL